MDIFRQIWIDLDRLCKWSCMFGNDSGFGCMMDRLLDRFWYACLDIFKQIWTGFGMHIWTLLVQFLIPKKTFNHFDYLLTDLFMHV
jgi:hypothetical protein